MSFNRIGEDFYISGSVSAVSFYGDGSNLTGVIGVTGSAGTSGTSGINGVAGTSGTSGAAGPAGAAGTSGTSGVSGGGSGQTGWGSTSTKISGYRLVSSNYKGYKLVRPTTSFSVGTNTINGEAIYITQFYANPGDLINEIAFRINTAGAAGLGLAAVRFLIYRSTLNANGEIIAGDLELDTGVNINTLSTGIKAVSNLNHTLSSNTYRNVWYMGLRNYQTGTLSVRTLTSSSTITEFGEITSSPTTMTREMSWYWAVPWTAAVPTTAPTQSASSASTTAVGEWQQIINIGFSEF